MGLLFLAGWISGAPFAASAFAFAFPLPCLVCPGRPRSKKKKKKQEIQEQPTNPLLFFSPGPRQESKQNNVPLVLMYAP